MVVNTTGYNHELPDRAAVKAGVAGTWKALSEIQKAWVRTYVWLNLRCVALLSVAFEPILSCPALLKSSTKYDGSFDALLYWSLLTHITKHNSTWLPSCWLLTKWGCLESIASKFGTVTNSFFMHVWMLCRVVTWYYNPSVPCLMVYETSYASCSTICGTQTQTVSLYKVP